MVGNKSEGLLQACISSLVLMNSSFNAILNDYIINDKSTARKDR